MPDSEFFFRSKQDAVDFSTVWMEQAGCAAGDIDCVRNLPVKTLVRYRMSFQPPCGV